MTTGMTREESLQQLERINFWIANCDTKASIVLGFLGVFTPLFFTSTPMLDSIKYAIHAISSGHVPMASGIIYSISGITITAMVVWIVLTFFFIFKSLTATVGDAVTHAAGIMTNSDMFFHAIKTKTFSNYYGNISHNSDQDMFRDIHSQIYINSHICSNKFEFYNNAVKYLKFALLGFLTLALMYALSFL